jgi:hypothetical protein
MKKPTYAIRTFCADHGNISKRHFHKLINDGKGACLMKIGRRALISIEAAADWRALMESHTNQTSHVQCLVEL